MRGLAKFLVESILGEAASIDKQIVVYSGRFQPFHKGHFATYQNLVKKFGADSVYIGTSNVTDNKKSPFNFNEKKAIMMKMFGIPSSKIVNVKNPYAPTEILSKYNDKTTGLIVVVGEKDENRLGGKYFTPYKGKVTEPYLDRGYVYASPATANPISGTDVRYWLSAGSEADRKKNFTKAYPKFDDQIFKMITLKLKKLKECINEEIKLNVKVGDTLLMGKFKNKKVVVKSIGEDEYGMPTINGKKAVTFRIPKKDELKEMGFPGGVGVGLSLPSGAINGAPNPKDVEKTKSKLKKIGDDHYELVDETIKKVDGKWVVYPKKGGDRLGTHDSYKSALSQLRAIERSKHENTIVEYSGNGAFYNDGNTTTGKQWNAGWDEYDNQSYYLDNLEGWDFFDDVPSEKEKKKAVDQKLPIDNHDDSVHKYNRTLKYGFTKPNEASDESIEGTTDAYPNKWDNDVHTDERTNIDESSAKDLEKQLVSLYNKAFKMMPNSPSQLKVRAEIDKLKKQIDSLKKESINESLLLEGGAYGHMNHPFDIEMNLTFGDLKQIVVRALNGDLELAREKTDGQALAVSWVNGRLVAARNKSHLKNKGAGAMTIGQVADKFANRGGLTDAYNFAMQDLSKAIAALSEPQRKKVFKDGACFMNLEVIYPTSVNVIPYNQPLLVFHGTFEYDANGTIIGENQEAAKILAGMIKQVNAHVQSKYTIQGPPMNKLPKSEHLSKLQGKYLGMISKLQSEFKLSDSDGVADYHQAWWSNFVEKKAKKLDYQQKIGLIKRWAFGDKSFRIADIKDDKLRAWADQTDKQDQQKISKQNLMRFEEIFLGVGADVLSFMESVLTANPDSAKRQMVSRLESTISQVKASGDPKKIAKLKLELDRLKALGGFEKIVPNEGIVFVYNGNTYKLTGAFAPLNQILGIFFDK